MISIGNWLVASAVIVGLWLIGDRILALLRVNLSRAERLGAGLGVGGGLMAFSLFLISWIGAPISGLVIAGLFALVLVGFFLLRLPRNVHQADQAQVPGRLVGRWAPSVTPVVMAAGILGLGVLAVLRSVGLAYHSWDAIALWGAKGYGIAKEASIFGAAEWGNFGLNYPLQLPILITIFVNLTGDLLPGSKLLFPAYYISLLALMYTFVHRTSGSTTFSMLATGALGSTPILFQHATIGYANLMFTYLLVGGTVFWIRFVQEREPGAGLLSGVLWGLAVWSRPEGIGLWIALLAAILLYQVLTGGDISDLRRVLWPSLIVVIPWLLFLMRYGTGGTHLAVVRSALSGIVVGQLHLGALYAIFRYLVGGIRGLEVWGLVLPLSAILLIFSCLLRPRILLEPEIALPLLAGLVVGLVIVSLYFATSYSPGLDIAYWLDTGFDRVMMPAIALSCLGALGAVGKVGFVPQNRSSAIQAAAVQRSPEGESGLVSEG